MVFSIAMSYDKPGGGASPALRFASTLVCMQYTDLTSIPLSFWERGFEAYLLPNVTRVGAVLVRSVLKLRNAIVAGYSITLSIIET